jgi:hypothetical protein
MFWRRPALRAGRRLSMGPPPAFGGRRPHKILPTRIQKLFASNFSGGASPRWGLAPPLAHPPFGVGALKISFFPFRFRNPLLKIEY